MREGLIDADAANDRPWTDWRRMLETSLYKQSLDGETPAEAAPTPKAATGKAKPKKTAKGKQESGSGTLF